MRILFVIALLAACDADLDPPWQLDHDRIVAVRATPPAIQAGERSELDALLAAKGGKTSIAVPEVALVIAPTSLSNALTFEGGKWIVTAPAEPDLAIARAQLNIAAGEPVPLQIGVSYAGNTLVGTKTVRLGATGTNPSLSTMMVDGDPADGKSELVVTPLVDVPLSIEAVETDTVNWLTSCGTMHDFDLAQAYLRVEEDDPIEGELAVVLRDERGGVTWRVWPIRAQ